MILWDFIHLIALYLHDIQVKVVKYLQQGLCRRFYTYVYIYKKNYCFGVVRYKDKDVSIMSNCHCVCQVKGMSVRERCAGKDVTLNHIKLNLFWHRKKIHLATCATSLPLSGLGLENLCYLLVCM